MKTYHHITLALVPLFILFLLLPSCSRDNSPEDPLSTDGVTRPPLMRQFKFIFADDDGNNLLPFHLPPFPVANPDKFHAYYFNKGAKVKIGEYTRNSKLGHLFWVRDEVEKLLKSDSFLKDSTFVFYPCFGSVCDTVIIYPNFTSGFQLCSTKKILWNGNHLGFYWNEYGNVGLVIGRDSSISYECHSIPLTPSLSNFF